MAKSPIIEQLTSEYWETALEQNKELMMEYLDNQTDLSDASLKQYHSALRVYLSYINKFCKNKHLTEIKAVEFQKYINWLLKCGILESAIRFKRSPVSMLNEYILLFYEDEYPTFRNYVTKGIKTPSTEKKFEKQPLTEAEIILVTEKLLEKEEWQLLAYFRFTYCTGCRRNETRQLLKEVVNYSPIERVVKLKDENGDEYEANVKKYKTNLIKTKGKKSKEKVRLNFDEDTLYYLNKWLEFRGEDDCPYVFITNMKNPQQVGLDTFNHWCKKIEGIVGRRVHPHLLRSSRATNLALSGKNLEAIQKLLGHASSDTTKIYIVKDDDDGDDEIFV